MAKAPFGVVVKFGDSVVLPYEDGVEAYIVSHGIGPWAELAARFPGITFVRGIASLSAQRIESLVAEARRRDPSYDPPNLRNYFVLRRETTAEAERLARAIESWPSVERAYVRSGPLPPPCTGPGPNPCRAEQLYLDPAPAGIDAAYAATLPGGKGQGQGFIDVEQGWHLDHEDFLDAAGASVVSLAWGVSHVHKPHGTSVLGIVLMRDNAIGGIGIVPSLGSMRVVSEWDAAGLPDREAAYGAAIDLLSFGDVLLLEGQAATATATDLPVEVEDLSYQAIRLATALGIVVIEPAGNGKHDLDAILDPARDSGAVIVAGSDAVPYHVRHDQTNFGHRVHCFAQAAHVVTAGDPALASKYTKTFGYTSAASAIVAGAALAVQGLAESHFGFRLSAQQIRALLSDAAANTPSYDPPADRIGVMPNLKAIADSLLAITPDVYVRDFVGDVGDPHSEPASASPDIILLPAAAADPNGSFGEGSGTEDDDALGAAAVGGSNNAIHVRVRNRGGSDASNVKIDVYWSAPSSLPTPPWNPVGSITIPTVPAGDVLTVSNAITWAAADIPLPGHYCLVALIGTARDPAPPIALFENWDNYKRFVRGHNNVAWRNIDVVAATGAPSGGAMDEAEAEFNAGGPPDRARRMRLSIESRLPAGSKLFLEGPPAVVASAGRPHPLSDKRGAARRARVAILPNALHRTEEILFAARERVPLVVRVELPRRRPRRDYWVRVRQWDGGEGVGAITIRVVTPARQKFLEKERVERWLAPQRAEGDRGVAPDER